MQNALLVTAALLTASPVTASPVTALLVTAGLSHTFFACFISCLVCMAAQTTSKAQDCAGITVIAFDVGAKNLGVSASNIQQNGDATLLWLDTADISASSADRCALRLWEYLDCVLDVIPSSKLTVLIENQPSKARSLMRSIELAIRHYFVMLHHQKRRKTEVKGVSPRSKLSHAVHYQPNLTQAQKYKARKDAAVKEASDLLSSLPEAQTFITTGKGDDAADSLLYHVRHCGAKRFIGMHEHALRCVRVRRDAKEGAKRAKVEEREQAKAEKAAQKAAEKAAQKARKLAERAAQKAAGKTRKTNSKQSNARQLVGRNDADPQLPSLLDLARLPCGDEEGSRLSHAGCHSPSGGLDACLQVGVPEAAEDDHLV